MRLFLFLLLFTSVLSCSKTDITETDPEINDPIDSSQTTLYFPPLSGDHWSRTDPVDIGWNADGIESLKQLLEDNYTRAFIILVDGKIVMEEYFGKGILNISDFDKNSQWYWASAGKTLTSFVTGKAQEEKYLDITNPSSDYLGEGWTSLTGTQESKITVWHQLTMTSGLNDLIFNSDSTHPDDLRYKAEAGSRWAYHNAPYTLLDAVVESAVNDEFENYFNATLRDRIGMDGEWVWLGDNHVYFSTARSMARFGLLIQNEGKWEEEDIMSDNDYFSEMINPSQQLNKSYGYLWWLNGQESHMLPGTQIVFQGPITPEAPDDMYSGIGKNGQYVSIIPSLNMVMVRMGDNPEEVNVPLLFQRDIWKEMNNILP